MEENPNAPGALVVEVEIPPLALLAKPTAKRGGDQQRDLGATLTELGDPQPARDAWDLAPRAATPIVAHVCGEASDASDVRDGVVRFCCEVPIPDAGERHVYRVSIQRTHTAADGSGTAWNAAPHATEEELIAVAASMEGDAQAAATTPAWQLPVRAGRANCIPGVRVLHLALSREGDVTRAWLEGAGSATPES